MGHHCPGLRLSGIFLKTFSVRERADALKKRGLKKVGFRVFSSHQKDERKSTVSRLFLSRMKLNQLSDGTSSHRNDIVSVGIYVHLTSAGARDVSTLQRKLRKDKVNNRVAIHPIMY